MIRVLVTGGTGFLGAHILVQLIRAGYDTRATIRNMNRKDDLLKMVEAGGVDPDGLTVFEADLESDTGWTNAAAGCDFVLHVASPFPSGSPDDENELIRPACEGTVRVLRASRDAGVKRVVMTSSFAAIGYGHPARSEAFTEDDWSNPKAADVFPYIRSKILAEQAAWRFIEEQGENLELSVINPTGIFGPVLGPDYSSSVDLIRAMLDGRMPFAPRVFFGVVDVRDVAALHLLAMSAPEAAGERFIAVAGEPVSMIAVARMLRRHLGTSAAKAPRLQLPDPFVRLIAKFAPALREVTPQLGKYRRASNEKALKTLGWSPRIPEKTIHATAESLLALGK